MNKISDIKTTPVRGQNGASSAIMIGVDILDKPSLEAFSLEVSGTFTSQMMISPEDTNKMLITIIGDCTAQEFKDAWLKIVHADPIIEYFMSKMEVADILHGTSDGKILDQVSLLQVGSSTKPPHGM